MAKANKSQTSRDEGVKAEDSRANTRSDVGSDTNELVDSTRIHTANSTNEQGEEITADNAEELITENEVAKRNREVGNIGTAHEEDNDTDVAKGFNL